MSDLAAIAPAFVTMAHRIVWCTAATIDPSGNPRTRILHPIWEWDGRTLIGWIATGPTSPKAAHLRANPNVSVTYWDATHDTCTADCHTEWELDDASRRAGWDRFTNAPAPVGYDPAMIPTWTDPSAESFGILRLEPKSLRVMPGSLLMTGVGEIMSWRAA